MIRDLLLWSERDDPPAIAAQSLPEPMAAPGFSRANPPPDIVGGMATKLWLGNQAIAQTPL